MSGYGLAVALLNAEGENEGLSDAVGRLGVLWAGRVCVCDLDTPLG